MLSKLILTAKITRKNNFKIQMLAGNILKICVGAGFEISSTLVILLFNVIDRILPLVSLLITQEIQFTKILVPNEQQQKQ